MNKITGRGSPFLEDEHANYHAAWCPDNRRLVFVRDRNVWEIDLGTRVLRQLTSGAVGNDAA